MATVFAQPGFTNLYLIGDATPSGWNIGAPVAAMVQDQTNANIFSWEGPLTAGELKISTFTGNWCDGQWLNASEANGSIQATSYIYTTGCDGPDNKWLILAEEAGNYKITINLMDETINFAKLSNDASLASITLSTGILLPLFDAGITEYTASVPNGTTSVDVTAQPNDMYAGLSGHGTIDVSSGSAVVSLVVTSADGSTTKTYTINIKVSDPYFSNLYLVGGATPAGWNIGTPEPMVQDELDSMIFNWEGTLIAGEFKISTFTGDWCDGVWINASQSNQVLFATDYIYTTGCDGPDNKWVVPVEAEGYYLIRVNLREKSISIENQMHDAQLSYLSVSIGTLDPVFDGLVTSYSAIVPFGTSSVNVVAVARSIGAVVTGAGIIDVSSGSGKATVEVTAPDEYLTKTYTIDITVSVPYYENLYLLGNATTVDWNIGAPIPMVQSEEDSMIFTWKGELKEGQFKISTFTGDWCDGTWIKASQADQVITATDYIYTNGCDGADNKWSVSATEAGEYLITVNLRNGSIVISSTTSINQNENIRTSVYPNPTSDILYINTVSELNATVSIYSIDGRELYQTSLSESLSAINLARLNTSGVVFVKVVTKKSNEVFKVVLK